MAFKSKYDGKCSTCGMSFPQGTLLRKAAGYGYEHAPSCPGSKAQAQAAADATLKAEAERKATERTTPSIVLDRDGRDWFSLPHPYDADFVAIVKALPSREWHREQKLWFVPADLLNDATIALARFSKAYAEAMANGAQFAAAREAYERTTVVADASRAASVDTNDVPVPAGLAYLPYQLAGISFISALAAALIGDEMGLGKTIQALGLINADVSIKKILVICPASLRLNWRREALKWLVRHFEICVVEGGTKKAWREGCGIYIINFDVLKKHHDAVHGTDWDLMIVDEAHFLKNGKTLRTQEVFGRWDKDEAKRKPAINAKKRLFLTGTPIPNRIIELWTLVRSLDPQGLGRNWTTFAKRYAAAYQTRWGWDTTGSSNLDELQQLMRSRFMVRRLKAQVLTELPAKIRQLLVLPPNGSVRAVKAEQKALAAAEAAQLELEITVALAKASSNPDAYADAVRELGEARQAAFTELSGLRHATALAKVPYVIEHIRSVVSSTGKVVVFAHHKDVVRALRSGLENPEKKGVDAISCVQLTGDTSMADRDRAVQDFQTDPSIQVFIGNIQAAGVGITLTAASHVIFAELSWVPGDISQCEDRCHRIGATDTVNIQHIVLDGSIDAIMAQTLIAKQAVLDAALDNSVEAVDPTDAIAAGREIADDAPSVFAVTEDVATAERAQLIEKRSIAQAAKRAQILKTAKSLTADQIAAVHEALREVAGWCDGARELDGQGFNKIDTGTGKSLAGRPELTPAEAALGMMIITKYRRQYSADVLGRIQGQGATA
jgi:SNF2 domain-containing protein/helicase-like protein